MLQAPLQPFQRISGTRLLAIFATCICITLLVMFTLRMTVRLEPPPLPRLEPLPSLELRSDTEARVNLKDICGTTPRLVLLDIHSANCGNSCIERSHQMEEIIYWNRPVAEQIMHVTILCEDFSREQLIQYKQPFHETKNWQWYLLDPKQCPEAVNGLGISESADLVLVDKEGILRRRYNTLNKPERRDLLLDVRALIKEAECGQ